MTATPAKWAGVIAAAEELRAALDNWRECPKVGAQRMDLAAEGLLAELANLWTPAEPAAGGPFFPAPPAAGAGLQPHRIDKTGADCPEFRLVEENGQPILEPALDLAHLEEMILDLYRVRWSYRLIAQGFHMTNEAVWAVISGG